MKIWFSNHLNIVGVNHWQTNAFVMLCSISQTMNKPFKTVQNYLGPNKIFVSDKLMTTMAFFDPFNDQNHNIVHTLELWVMHP